MIRFLLASLLLLPSLAQAQLHLLVVPDSGDEQPAPGVVDLGTPYVGDSSELKMRVRNDGAVKASIDKMYIAGSGFELTQNPTIPWILAAGASVDFTVRFAPKQFGSYSAGLTVNTISILLVGRTPAALSLLFGDSLLGAATPLDFGTVQRGSSASRTLILRNDTNASLPVPAVTVLGDAFRGPDGLTGITALSAGSSASFSITFTPQAASPQDGWLTVGGRSYRLLGTGVNPPFPKPSLYLDNPVSTSGARAHVLISFNVAAPFDATGTLQMDFQPATAGVADDAIQFVAGGRSVPFTIANGQMSGVVDSEFQTGTTAGQIIFTATAAGWTSTLTVPVNPQAVSFDSAKATRSTGQVQLNASGFDNTRSVSKLTFTFYLSDGSPLPGGAVSVDAASNFATYFSSSTLGGAFSLRVTFPVSGDVTMLGGVEMQAVNTAGTAATQRLVF